MLNGKYIEDYRRKHQDKIIYDEIYVEMDDGSIRQVCSITNINGKLVLKPSVRMK